MTRFSKYLPLMFVLALAIALSSNGLALAQAQPQFISAYQDGDLPVADPLSAAWDSVPVYTASVTPQSAIKPTLFQATISSIDVQSLNNGKDIVFRLVWTDETQDLHATKPDEFRDAAALQFSVQDLDAEQTQKILCMGAAGQLTNLWHWKADWQYDVDEGFFDVVDAYPNFWLDHYPFVVGEPPFRLPTDFNSDSAKRYLIGWSAGNPLSDPARVTPVEDLNAYGFGTVTSQANQDLLGRGVWQDGKWYVVFSRSLTDNDAADIQFTTDRSFSIAFAAWDGSDQQVGARKQLSTWTTMLLETKEGIAGPAKKILGLPIGAAIAVGVVVVLVILGGVLLVMRRRKAA
ncbi:MAG: hypothetical protein FJZ87_00325 [Chloroflexi bacterium]|nr:hypothetical protein [Chloroflexota bacterium]